MSPAVDAVADPAFEVRDHHAEQRAVVRDIQRVGRVHRDLGEGAGDAAACRVVVRGRVAEERRPVANREQACADDARPLAEVAHEQAGIRLLDVGHRARLLSAIREHRVRHLHVAVALRRWRPRRRGPARDEQPGSAAGSLDH